MQPTTLQELIDATGGRPVGARRSLVVSGPVTIDSRQVQPKGIFWAVPGERLDGHDFLADAWKRNAALCVIDEQHESQVGWSFRRRPYLVVHDTVQALQHFAAWHRQRSDAFVVGITGSVGKTTTRQMLHAVLSAGNRGVQSPANFNNHLGVPLSLLQVSPEDEFCVLEMGASRVGEIRALCDIAQPEAGILTAIAPAHLDEFGSLDNVMQAKSELITSIGEQGFAVINGDDERCRALTGKCRCEVILVGEHAFNDVVASHVEHHNGRLSFRVERTPFQVAAAGRHLLTSALATIALARQIEMDDELIAAGLAKFQPGHGRCHPRSIGNWTVIDDTYNASPASMMAACRLLAEWQTTGKKLLCLGDMLALGSESENYHRQLGAFISKSAIDRLIAIGEGAILAAEHARAGGMDPGCIGICLDDAMAHFLFDLWLEPGDVILVKGSRGMGMERFITHLSNQVHTQEAPLRKSA